jgi:hypothetical protein
MDVEDISITTWLPEDRIGQGRHHYEGVTKVGGFWRKSVDDEGNEVTLPTPLWFLNQRSQETSSRWEVALAKLDYKPAFTIGNHKAYCRLSDGKYILQRTPNSLLEEFEFGSNTSTKRLSFRELLLKLHEKKKDATLSYAS